MSEAKERLLIVEDDMDLAEMLGNYFRHQGYEVDVAHWGEDGVMQATSLPPDMAILDIRLPDIDGYEVCRRLRAHRLTADLPVIFLTERREREDKLAGLELGAVDYITKPFDIKELRLRVRNVLRRLHFESLVNPVTGLPEGTEVREKLSDLLEEPNWTMVVIGLRGLNSFRDRYGFVAADDAARAVSLMIKKGMDEVGAKSAFIGHIDPHDFVVITDRKRASNLATECRERIDKGIQYFYPQIDRSQLEDLPPARRLHTEVLQIHAEDGPFPNLSVLRQALMERSAP